MGWLILAALAAVVLVGWAWCDLVDKAENIETDEPWDFWMTED